VCDECGHADPTEAHKNAATDAWCVGGACPLCGLPSLWSKADKKCSPLSGCAAWTTTAVFDKPNRRWQPTDADGFALDGSYVGPVIQP
jgi:hypothetical protein